MIKFSRLNSIVVLFILIITITCSTKPSEVAKKPNNLFEEVCDIIGGDWVFEADPNFCKNGKCTDSWVTASMKLNCKNNKIFGKQLASVDSKSDKTYWDDVTSQIEENQIILMSTHFYFREEKKEPVGKMTFTIKEVKAGKLFGDYTGDFFFNSKNRRVIQQKFVAKKTR